MSDIQSESLRPFYHPDYQPPSTQELLSLMKDCAWTGAKVGALVGVDSRTVRRWTEGERPIPYSAWRLLLLYAAVGMSKSVKVEPETNKYFKVSDGLEKNSILTGCSPTFKGKNTVGFFQDSSDNLINIGDNVICDNLKIVFKGHGNKLIIENNVKWTGYILIVGKNRTVKIGKNTTAQGVCILSRDEDVTIGSNCMLSREIEIRSTDVHKIYCLDSGDRLNPAMPIIIDDNVWVAARVILSKGTKIASSSIVGASSFVNKAFSDKNVIIAGAPAKIVKRNIRWER